ncbi:hypothetical protein PV08_09239 [Exophiala spinifera]|uniref:Peptidase S33 tripeptidyl aminopeptidase-like C-terminal domain-containing protein n=1 Tax=Exophiala spinifera TaxID=91928 RepID=A0A0D2AZV9_9EURO|nr:uncharacterized protein PV08_09239 [Exophiala spinifera]KIW11965.1 hypothetical protein PV08_09239 [Exophiala spinifera]
MLVLTGVGPSRINEDANAFTTHLFPDLVGRDTHILGESFGSSLTPVGETYLLDRSIPGPQVKLDVKSIALTSPFVDVGFSSPSLRLASRSITCGTFLREISCTVSTTTETVPGEYNEDDDPLVSVEKPCYSFPTCSPWVATVEKYLNDPGLQARLGLQDKVPVDFHVMDMDINAAFSSSMTRSNLSRVTYLLEDTPTRVLLRSGRLDPDANGGSGPSRIWTACRRGGKIKNSTGLTFVTFENAGHMVPGDDSAGASAALSEWLSS